MQPAFNRVIFHIDALLLYTIGVILSTKRILIVASLYLKIGI